MPVVSSHGPKHEYRFENDSSVFCLYFLLTIEVECHQMNIINESR
jgi:hypothetical protein